MKVITLMTAGHVGGIETLVKDYAYYSRHDNVVLILWGDGNIDEQMKQLGIKVINLHASRGNIPDTVSKAMKVIKEEKADVLIAQHEAAMSHLILMYAKRKMPQIRTIAYAQLNAVDMIRANEKKRLWLRKAILGTSLKRADEVVAISKSVKQSLVDMFDIAATSINIIYNGTDLRNYPYIRKESDTKPYKLVYVGRLIEEKGVQLTLKALSELDRSYGYSLRIIGDGPYRDKLEQLTDEYGLRDIVEFLGSRNDVPDLIHDSDIFIHMPIWAEGFGIAVVEAMSAGLVCICAENGAMPELITDGNNGFLVPKGDFDALTDILRMISDMSAEDLRRISKAAHVRAADFSIDIFVDRLDDLAENRYITNPV